MGEMAREELDNLTSKLDKLNSDLEVILLPKDPNDLKMLLLKLEGKFWRR